jgi:hypothetical protein
MESRFSRFRSTPFHFRNQPHMNLGQERHFRSSRENVSKSKRVLQDYFQSSYNAISPWLIALEQHRIIHGSSRSVGFSTSGV